MLKTATDRIKSRFSDGLGEGETPEQAALRELQEECGLDGEIVRQLATLYCRNGNIEHVFEVKIPKDQEPIIGHDPEEPADAQPIKDVHWIALNELPERDRAFLWSYGLIQMEGFFEEIKGWGDEISYPNDDSIRKRLLALRDPQYKAFQSKLMPTVDPEKIIGIRVPVLQKLAKELWREAGNQLNKTTGKSTVNKTANPKITTGKNTKNAGFRQNLTETVANTGDFSEKNKNNRCFLQEDLQNFLHTLPHTYYEENNLHMFLLGFIRDFDACIRELDAFLPYVNNWATCDAAPPKVLAGHPEELLAQIKIWILSGHTYTVRYAIGLLMRFYLDEHFDTAYPDMVAALHSDEYYVNMMRAWYFATALAKQYDAVLLYLTENRLDLWTHNKTIQKAVESYRITPEQKEYLKTLRRKK